MLRMAGTAARRDASRELITDLLQRSDQHSLRETLERQRLLALVGSRLEVAAPEALNEGLRTAAREAMTAGRRQSVLYEELTVRLVSALHDAGVRVLPLKGPLLSRRLHGDPGARSVSADIDLLVSARSLRAAIETLEAAGYAAPTGTAWADGLPLFEHGLAPRVPWLPRVDLHWRVHWYERRFSERLLERKLVDDAGTPRPAPEDELAMLLLMYSRDGFWGLRLPADIAAWWDRYGHELGSDGLRSIASEHPELVPALASAAVVCERIVGLPAERLLDAKALGRRRSRLAARLANWGAEGQQSQYSANVKLVDCLLVPGGGRLAFARRHVLLPRTVIATMYGLPEDAYARQSFRQLWHSAIFTRYTVGPWSQALWRTRFGRDPYGAPPA